jgi:hypothetical protein
MFDPVADVEYVTDDLAAARLRVEFEHTLRTNTQLTEDEHAEIRSALAKLDQDWPNAHREALAATEHELYGPGGMPRGYRQTRHTLRQEHGVNAGSAARMRRERSSPAGASHPRAGGRSRRRSGSRRELVITAGDAGRQAARFTGADTVAAGAGDIALATVRIGLGLALAYFLLTSRGSKGFAGVLGAITYGVRAFIAPVDPLHRPARPTGKGGTFLPANVGGIPAQQVGESDAAFDRRMGAYLQSPEAFARAARARAAAAPPVPVPTPSGAAIFGAPSLGGFPPTG